MRNVLLIFALVGAFALSAHGADPSPTPSAAPLAVEQMQAVPSIVAPPEWLTGVLVWVNSIPAVGPVFAMIAKWAGVLLEVLTGLCGFLIVLSKSLSGISKLAPVLGWLGKIGEWIGLAIPWLKYFSAFNQPQAPWKDPKAGGG